MKKAVIFLVLVVLIVPAVAANKFVTPAGSGSRTGDDWSNALAGSFTPARGNTYYVGDGSYGSKTFDTAASGTTLITIRKCTNNDNVSSAVPGYAPTLCDGQAVWSHWDVLSDYFVFDGGTRDPDWRSGSTSQYGIKVSGVRPVRLDNGAGIGGDYLTFRYIDIQGGGRDTGSGDDVIYGLAANKNVTFQYCALHDSDRTIFLMRGQWQNLLVEHCYIARNSSNPSIHGEILSDVGSDYVTFRYNVIEDAEGTAVWAVLNGSGSKSSENTANFWKVYGNVIRSSAGYNREGFSGIMFVGNDAENRNWMDNLSYFNNTHINLKSNWFGTYIVAPGTGNSVKNNVWYSSGPTEHVNPGSIDFNWYYNTSNDDPGPNKITCTVNCSIYFSNISSFDVTLKAAIPGQGLSSEYARDPDGRTRGADGTWDRGAFEFGGTPAGDPPAPPTNLTVIVQ